MEVRDAPSEAQSINIEQWKEERNKEMAELPTCEMFSSTGHKCRVNVSDIEEFKAKGYREVDEIGKAKDEPIESKIKQHTKKISK